MSGSQFGNSEHLQLDLSSKTCKNLIFDLNMLNFLMKFDYLTDAQLLQRLEIANIMKSYRKAVILHNLQLHVHEN